MVRVFSGVVFSPDDWPGLLGVVNRYNREVRAKGYVEFGSDDHDPKAKVVGEFELPLVAGVTDDQLGALVTWGIHTGSSCTASSPPTSRATRSPPRCRPPPSSRTGCAACPERPA